MIRPAPLARPGAALLTAAFLAFASSASAAPATTTSTPIVPPAPADPTQPPNNGEPAPADPVATPGDPGSEPAAPTGPAAKQPTTLSEAETLVARAGLDIDTAQAGPSGPIIVSRMEELGNLELRRAEILPSRLGNDPVIRIRVALQEGTSDVFLIRAEVAIRGEQLEGSARDVTCSLCTESEVVERARGEIVRLVPYVRSQFKAPEKPPPVVEVKPAQPKPEPRGLATMGKAGVGLLAGGVVVTATGLGLSLAENPTDPNDATRSINIHPAGYAILAVGGAAIIAGAVLLGLDRRNAKRSVAIAPTGGPSSAGIVLIGRF